MPKKESKDQKSETGSSSDYGAKDIFVLEGLDPVRKRPGMYIGSTGPDGLHHLISEIVDNSIDEAMAGYAKNIEVTLLPQNRVRVSDDGRGIPVDIHKQTKKSALETIMTTLHAGGKFGGGAYKVSGGLHGVGASVVNALSVYMRVEVCKDGSLYAQEYERGKPKASVKKIGKCGANGTVVTFEPDPQIFSEIEFNGKRVLDRLRQQAYLTRGIRISFGDQRAAEGESRQGQEESPVGERYSFYFEGGIKSFVKHLNRDITVIHDTVFYAERTVNDIQIEIALQYADDLQAREMGFANNIHTPEGGMHITGFRTALTRVLNDYSRKNSYLKQDEENLIGEDVREGLTVVVSVKLKETQFEGQTKSKLGNPEARTAVESFFADAFVMYLEESPADARAIAGKVILASKARKAAKAAKDTILRKGILEGMTLPGKLADCQSKSAEESEIFIVEGDSAGGSAKGARDRRTQAILPLRGKILNVERARLDKMLASKEIRSLVIALGAAIAEEFSLEKIRYHKIVIMTDADVDGAHIRTLLLTLFYRYYRPVIDAGYLYIAQPPLYKISRGREFRYAYSDAEKEKVLKEMQEKHEVQEEKRSAALTRVEVAKTQQEDRDTEPKDEQSEEQGIGETYKGFKIQRYKGLGEMNADQLWETTMDPAQRSLLRVNIRDAAEADHIFDILMGDEVAPRKSFIQTHAKLVKNLDI